MMMMMMENRFPDDDDDDDDIHRLLVLLIPEDVLIEILVWLPVKSLLRFKSVCKSWLALIESSSFIHLHTVTTTTSSSSNKFGTFMFETNTTTETRFFMLTSRSGNGNGGGGEDEVFEVEDFGFPPFYKTTTTTVPVVAMAGSCNGLICLTHGSTNNNLRGGGGGGDVSLWNPATKQFRLLPKSLTTFKEEEEEEIDRHVQDVFGFGFDVKTKDYKVVKITSFFLHGKVEFVFRVQVYSLSSNSWKLLEGDGGINSLFPNKPVTQLYIDDGVYLNGSYFFKVEDEMREWVLSFDFTKQIFTTMQFNHDPISPLFLACYYFGEKKIASLSRGRGRGRGGGDDDQSNFVYDIWVLNIDHDQEEEEEEEESYYWTKLQHSIRIRKGKESTWQLIIPRFISNEGEFALIETRGGNGRKLQLFNLVTKEEKTVFPTGLGLRRAVVYKPSLVSIVRGGGNGNGNGNGSSSSS